MVVFMKYVKYEKVLLKQKRFKKISILIFHFLKAKQNHDQFGKISTCKISEQNSTCISNGMYNFYNKKFKIPYSKYGIIDFFKYSRCCKLC